MASEKKILNLHDKLMVLSREKYNAQSQGKTYDKGTSTFQNDLFTFIGDWQDFLTIRQEKIGDQFLMFTAGVVNTTFEQVSAINKVQATDYTRGPYVGPFEMTNWDYFNGSPPSLVMTGDEHVQARSLVWEAQPDPTSKGSWLNRICILVLEDYTKLNALNLGKPTQKAILDVLHRMFFDLELSNAELGQGADYANSIPVAAIPKFVGALPAAVCKAYAEKMANKYVAAPGFANAKAAGAAVGWDAKKTAKALFGTVHLASMPACAALASSVVGRIIKHDLMDRIRAEYDSIVGSDGYLDQADVDGLPLIRKVVMETARMNAPVRTVNAVTKEPQSAAIGGDICPFHKGERWMVNLHMSNTDPARWSNPETFDLTRDWGKDVMTWNGYDGTKTVGRDCTGTKMSIQLISTFVLTLFGRYTWKAIKADKIAWDTVQFGPNRPKIGALKADIVLQHMKDR